MIEEIISDTERSVNKRRWEKYLSQRTGTYEFRCRRYQAVYAQLILNGLKPDDLIVDVGAGMCEFDTYLRSMGWSGRYLPVDGAIDGTDLSGWGPSTRADFFVAIEVLEHLPQPFLLMSLLSMFAEKAVVITTPNADTVDVLALDPTHLVPLHLYDFTDHGWITETKSLFGKPDDTIIATYSNPDRRSA